eukprot:3907307-Pleurochrysis_carterae.AAC.1
MWYAPGERRLRPRLTPSQARGSIVVLEYAMRGLTASALQPKGKMGMTLGFCPVRDSKDERWQRGGPVVRFSMSTAWEAAWVQKDVSAPAAVRLAR